MLMASMPADIQAMGFRWDRAIFGRYDVIHLHWPELLLRDREWFRSTLKKLLFTMMFARLVIVRTPIVQTVHNIAPHENGLRFEERMLRALGRRTGTWIALSPTGVDFASGRMVQILHGHYRDWFGHRAPADTAPGRYLFFGLIRPYKQVDSLITAFNELTDPATSLRLVGELSDRAVADKVAALGDSQPGISAGFEFVTDEQLAGELGRAELVVLPYKEFYNWGAALLSLSLGRPVLTPRNSASEALHVRSGEVHQRSRPHPVPARLMLRGLLRDPVHGRGLAGPAVVR